MGLIILITELLIAAAVGIRITTYMRDQNAFKNCIALIATSVFMLKELMESKKNSGAHKPGTTIMKTGVHK